MKNICENSVRGDNFFKREKLVKKTWELIETGDHILIVAPRRVGKTSLMNYILDNPKEDYILCYMNLQSVNNENEFYKRVVNNLISEDFISKFEKTKTATVDFIKNFKITKVGLDGIEIGKNDAPDYRKQFEKLITNIDLDSKKLIIMIDEFPQILENIVKDEGERNGIHFLNTNRELRQNINIQNKVQFIYTGSIGLENIAVKLNAIGGLNDLVRLKIIPLSENQSKELINLLLKKKEFSLTDTNVDYILSKIEWLIPFYIQLIIRAIGDVLSERESENVSEEIIDMAFEEMLEQRNHFEHWLTRLRSSVTNKDEYNLAKEILNFISENEKITSIEIINFAEKHKLADGYKNIINSLIYDGYINNNDDVKIYRYNSPILKMWWFKNVAN